MEAMCLNIRFFARGEGLQMNPKFSARRYYSAAVWRRWGTTLWVAIIYFRRAEVSGGHISE